MPGVVLCEAKIKMGYHLAAKPPKIKWSDYDKSDWKRAPGAARNFVNAKTGQQISRRQFDQHYGAVRAYGTNEKKAKLKSRETEAILRPARGRSNALKLSGDAKIAELARRRAAAKEKAAAKKITTLSARNYKTPQKITLANFKQGKISRYFEFGDEYQPIEIVRFEAAKSKIVFGYIAGVRLVHVVTGEDFAISAFQLRWIGDKFTYDDYENVMEKAREISYGRIVGTFIKLSLKIDIAEKKKGVKVHRMRKS